MASVVATNQLWNTTAGSKAISPTPAVGELIVVVVAHSGVTSGAICSDNQTGGTYTRIGTFALNRSSADLLTVFVRDNLVASAVAHTITAGGVSGSTGGGLVAIRVSGMTKVGSSAVRSVSGTPQFQKQENQAAGTPAPVLPAAPLSANLIIGAVLTQSNSSSNTAPT